jgi:hypothetical protein
LRFKRKEREKLLSRRRLWAIFGWFWAYKRNDGGDYVTDYTCDVADGGGMGFFKKHHSLNCGCGMCRDETIRRRHENKSKRLKERNKVRELLKVIKGQNQLD